MKNLNFLEYSIGEKKLYIFKDHSVAIKCLKKAFDEGIIHKGNFLVHIDDHSDSILQEKNIDFSRSLLSKDLGEIDKFIQNDLRLDNAEFILPLMISGLVGDVLSVDREFVPNGFLEEVPESPFQNSEYYSLRGFDGKIFPFTYGSISNLFSPRGALADSAKYLDIIKIYENNPLVLDVDLDFFTYSNDRTFARNKRDITEQVGSSDFKQLFDRANVVLIALEPGCCGGDEDCLEILEVFQKEVFDSCGLSVLEEVKGEFFDGK